MSHLRPEDRSARATRSACRKGRHHYGASHDVGAGIQRRVCEACGEVSIDLTGVEEDTDTVLHASASIQFPPNPGFIERRTHP